MAGSVQCVGAYGVCSVLAGGVALPGHMVVVRPPRVRQMARLLFDQAAVKMPLRLYERLHVGRWLSPR